MSAEDAYLRPSMRNLEKPKVDDDRGSLRIKLAAVLDSRVFHAVVVAVISFNVFLIIDETDASAKCIQERDDCTTNGPSRTGHRPQINKVILGFYLAELVVRLYVSRWRFFHNCANMIDFVIVLLGFVDLIMARLLAESGRLPNFGFLRMFRLLRVVRFSRLLSVFPELLSMARGFFKAMAAMAWGFALLVLMLMMFAVVTVELAYPVAQTMLDRGEDFVDCAERLSQVHTTMLLFFQTLVAGDSWGVCSMPLVKEQSWLFLILGFSLVCIQLGLTNLILSTVLESAYKAHATDERADRLKKMDEEKNNVRRILDYMTQMDTDDSGGISISELEAGYEEIAEFRQLFETMELDAKDLKNLFHMADTNGDGMCSYAEVIDLIRKCHDQDVKTQLMFLKLQLSQISIRLEHNLTYELQRGLRGLTHTSSRFQVEAYPSNGPEGPEDAAKEDRAPPRSASEVDFYHSACVAAVPPGSDHPGGGDGSGTDSTKAERPGDSSGSERGPALVDRSTVTV